MMEGFPSATSAASILTSFTWGPTQLGQGRLIKRVSDSSRQKQQIHCGTHISFLEEREDLSDIVESENTMGGLLKSMQL